MAKFHCRCGHTIRLQTEADPEENVLVNRITILNQCDELEDKNRTIDAEGLHDFLYDKGIDVIICPKCTRIYIDHNDDSRYTAYVNEDNPPAD